MTLTRTLRWTLTIMRDGSCRVRIDRRWSWTVEEH